MVRKIIVVGDPTSSGGRVVSGTPLTDIDGMPVARLGDRVSCPKHKGVFAIVSGDITLVIDGQPVARERDSVACGCTLVSTRQSHAFLDDGAKAGAAKTVPGGPLEAGAAQPSPAGLRPAALAGPGKDGQPDTPVAVTLRIGVFFDGTNNNASNVALGAQCRASTGDALGQEAEEQAAIAAHCRPYMLRDGSSYDNGITNVARLFDLYRNNLESPPENGADTFALRVYVDGIGTTAGEQDSKLSQGLGSGNSGVVARVEEAFRTLIPEELRQFSEANSMQEVKEVEFDVFGFSRGAAAARHFVHLVNRKGHGPLGQALLNRGVRYAPEFEFVEGVRVGFVGLFDSVAALGSLADGLNVRDGHNGPLQQALPAGCARQVVHLVARDERRANFMLTSAAPPHRENALPGVHSDLGGGYHRDREGPLLLSKPAGFVESHAGLVPGQAPDRARIERSRAYVQAAAEADRWRRHLGLSETQVRVEAWHLWQAQRRAGSASTLPEQVLRIYAAVVLERALDWRYQLIPLRLMHKLATEAGSTLKPIPDDPEFMLPMDLQPIADKLVSGGKLNEAEEAMLRRNYLHQSAHWNFAQVRNPVSLDLLYVNRPDPSGKRGVFPNL